MSADEFSACPGYVAAKEKDREESERLGFNNPLCFITGHLLHCDVCGDVLARGDYGFHKIHFAKGEE